MELVEAIAERLVASGLCTGLYSTSGISAQVNSRRETGAPTIVVVAQVAGTHGEKGQRELPTFQCLVDSASGDGARTVARAIHDHLHELEPQTLSGMSLLWVRAIAPPQAIPIGPGESGRFHFSVNFDACIRKSGNH
jgi:hypothetical protein